jgi:hypothetical protein
MCFVSLAMGIILNSALISPIATYLQGRLTQRIMKKIYDDLANNGLGFLHEKGKSTEEP